MDKPNTHGGYTIVCVDPLDLSLQKTVGIFETQEDAVQWAENDRECQKDWHWTITANEMPIEAKLREQFEREHHEG